MTDDTPPDRLARLRRYADILADFGRLAPESTEVDRLLQLACVQAARGIGINHTKILRHRPETGDLLIVAGVGWRPGVVGQVSLGGDMASPPGQALQTRNPVATEDLPNDPEFRYATVLQDHGIVATLNVPIAVNGSVWGVLEVDSDRPRHFGPDDTSFLTTMGSMLGLAIRLRATQDAAAAAAAEAARVLSQERMFFGELQHRNKNDLQLILALLVVQRRRLPDEEGRRVIAEVMDRVTAIGIAHDQLAHGRGGGSIDVADYLRSLAGNLAQRRHGVAIETAVDQMLMPHVRAVPIGLIVNELVTNALKHAFPDSRTGVIAVTFRAEEGGEGVLTVVDDGVGMGPPRAGSAGTTLVGRLVKQLGGRIDRADGARGVGFAVRFPLVT